MPQKQFGQTTSDAGGLVPAGLIKSGGVGITTYGIANFLVNQPILGLCTSVTPAGVAGVFSTIYSASGKGALQFLAISNFDAVTRTHFLRVTIDGNRVFDITSNHATTQDVTIILGSALATVGPGTVTNICLITESLLFNSSLLIEYASSDTIANPVRVAYRVIPR